MSTPSVSQMVRAYLADITVEVASAVQLAEQGDLRDAAKVCNDAILLTRKLQAYCKRKAGRR